MRKITEHITKAVIAGAVLAGGLTTAALPAFAATAPAPVSAEAATAQDWVFHSFWHTYNACHMEGHNLIMNGVAAQYQCGPASGEYAYALWYVPR
ncbi:hypothetical protein [Amycolatopsis magusensis]|uniref:hypothetical protein n=1 Tax=Amycolatopsis magusensis TaxID=882444 RepID=UPI003C2F560E